MCLTYKAIVISLPFWLTSFFLPKGSTSGPAKIRRAIEKLRTDVVKGLGVKLLDRVLEIMEEEDENKREVRFKENGFDKFNTRGVTFKTFQLHQVYTSRL